jgi:hypothetical protein
MISKALVAASTKPLFLSVLKDGESYGYQIIIGEFPGPFQKDSRGFDPNYVAVDGRRIFKNHFISGTHLIHPSKRYVLRISKLIIILFFFFSAIWRPNLRQISRSSE